MYDDTLAPGIPIDPVLPAWMGFVWSLFMVAVYIYWAYCLMKIGRKLGATNDWMAWIPVLNVYYLIKIAGKPGWWFILIFIPFVNFIVMVVVLVGMLNRLNRSGWGVILLMIPFVNLIYMGVLAFSQNGQANISQANQPPQVMTGM